jgi:hypothetical protein
VDSVTGFAIIYGSLNVKVYQCEADHAYYKALTDRRFPSCYVTSQEMFQLPILKLSCSERTHKIAVNKEACSNSCILHVVKMNLHIYIYLLTGDSTEQFTESQHPIPFASNTGCSVRLDTHSWKLK